MERSAVPDGDPVGEISSGDPVGEISSDSPAREVKIRGDGIRLGQLLKLAGVVGSGGEGKELLAAGTVRVNGAREQRRGRQLHDGDVVAVGQLELRVAGSA